MDGEIQYLGDLQRIERKPGDMFVLSVDKSLTYDVAEKLRIAMEDRLGAPVIVLAEGIRLGVVSADLAA